SVVINMDLPWNPAVLEQRIGRVHRLGQRQPVRVVNFVAQATIEEGMLSVLKFKRSLFAGVLDGGEKEVFLGGSRLTKFMETVENTTQAIPVTALEERREDQRAAEGEVNGEAAAAQAAAETEAARPAVTDQANPLAGLLQTGMSLLQQLAVASRSGPAPGQAPSERPGLSFVARDQTTGESYLKFPMPSAEVLDKALSAFGVLLESFRR